MQTPENPYRTHLSSGLTKSDVAQRVRLAGWVQRIRDHGQLRFVDLRDAHGVTQLVLQGDEALAEWNEIRVESVVTVEGEVRARPADTINPAMTTGEIELAVETVEVLSAADQVPFRPGDTNVSDAQRLHYRFMELRDGEIRQNLLLRSEALHAVRTYLHEHDFTEVETPILTATSPEGARDFLVPSRRYRGQFYALPQSPQLFKQLLMASGVHKYFQIAPCFRDEDSRADRSPGQHTQIDLEFSFGTQDIVFAEVEGMMRSITAKLSTKKLADTAFERITYEDAIGRYGSDKPDLRFGLQLADVTGIEALAKSDFLQPFIEKGSVIRALRIPAAFGLSRATMDAVSKTVKDAGAAAVSWLTLEGEGAKGGLAKWFTGQPEQLEAFAASVEAQDGDAILIAAGEWETASIALGRIRTAIGAQLELGDPDILHYAWVVDFPMFERGDTGAWEFSHNPFSMPQGGLEALRTQDPGDIKAWQYDLVCNGIELSSGAVRNHLPEALREAFKIAGYGDKDVATYFPALWNAFHLGTPPHAGVAPGFDRILMILSGTENFRDVVAFPLDQNAKDLMMSAPSAATDVQLKELGLQIIPEEPAK